MKIVRSAPGKAFRHPSRTLLLNPIEKGDSWNLGTRPKLARGRFGGYERVVFLGDFRAFALHNAPMDPIALQDALSKRLKRLKFADPVDRVYNPLEYARASSEMYLDRYFRPGVEALWLGMNPGPWGMAQTGVPFGEIAAARDWLGLQAPVGKPKNEHPKRPIQGYDCPRSEVSGRRVWNWAQSRYSKPGAFFDQFFVWNYCPLVFMEASGKNRTPDKLPAEERNRLFKLCDQSLRDLVELLQPERIIGVGRFATDRAKVALKGAELPIHTVLHPSPASPMANRGWAEQAEKQLEAMGIRLPAR